jgi:predicted nucleic acid-binding protein
MSVFVDTNVLLRTTEPSDPLHDAAVAATTELIRSGETLFITPQMLAEFWTVATRPTEKNGLGLSIEEAFDELARIEQFFTIVSESPDVYREWKRALVRHQVMGVDAHDTRLVAAMNTYGIKRILTFDDGFARYAGIEVLHPRTVASP